MASLKEIDPRVEVVHLLDYLGTQGTPDDQWVPRVAQDGDWVVVTADSGRSGRGAPLQLLLPRHEVSAVFLSGKLAQAPGLEKCRAIISQVPQIRTACDEQPAGTRFRITRQGQGFRFRRWPLAHHPPKPPA